MSQETYYTGFWINRAQGEALGLTLTLSVRDGGLLISFLTLFVRVVGNHLWGIIRFLLHQFRATPEPRDGLYHQQQAVFRNITSQFQTLIKLAILAGAWRSNADRTKRRSLPLMAFIAMHLSAITLAGLFTSRVASSSKDALVVPNTCGYWPEPDVNRTDNGANHFNDYNAYTTNNRGVMQRSSSYENNCYSGDATAENCNSYTVEFINSKADRNYSCPLSNDACWFDNYNIQLDTGYINSNLHLGMNTRDEDSVSYRKITTCAPFDPSPWQSDWHVGAANVLPGDTGLYLYLGPEIGATAVVGDLASTVFLSNYSRYYPTQTYVLSWAESVLNDPSHSFFTPNATFFDQTDEDVLVMFLQNYAQYPQQVYDSWFFADIEIDNKGTLGGTYYVADPVLHTMFCTEQHQFCNPNLQTFGTGCTSLTGRTVARTNLEADQGQSIGLTSLQYTTAYRISQNLNQFAISSVLSYLGSPSLLAQEYLDTLNYNANFLSETLDALQWQYEIMNWHNITLANMQRWAVDYAYGPIDVSNRQYIVPPATPEAQAMCSRQRSRFVNAMSFSGPGIFIILIVGSVIIVTDLCLPFVVAFAQNHLKRGISQRVAWIMDETWQLQRMAYEGSGQGLWRLEESAVPLTHKGEKFGPPKLAHHGVPTEDQYVHLEPKP